MKSLIFFGIIYLLLLPLLAIGCERGKETPPITTIPVTNTNEASKVIDITLSSFTDNKNVVQNIELVKAGSLTVQLESNPTTGYEWAEAVISDKAILAQANRNFEGPEDTTLVGAGGTDVWTFSSLKAGTATITFSYGRSWEPDSLYTLTINVTVK